MKKILLCVVSFLFTASLLAQQYPYQNTKLSADARAKDLLSRLTLEEKAALNEMKKNYLVAEQKIDNETFDK